MDAIREAASVQTYWVPGPILAGIYADAVIAKLSQRGWPGIGSEEHHG